MTRAEPSSSTSHASALAFESAAEGLVRRRLLRHGDTFAVLDQRGDCPAAPGGSSGVYHAETRYLSHSVLRIGGYRPLLLGSAISEDNSELAVDLACPGVEDGRQSIPRDSLHVLRSKLVWNATCYERLLLTNHGNVTARLLVELELGTDFADLFEVRGVRRERSGKLLPAEVHRSALVYAYLGLDQRQRRTRIRFTPVPLRVERSSVSFWLELDPDEERSIEVAVECISPDAPAPPVAVAGFAEADARSRAELAARRERSCSVETSNSSFNAWLTRSFADCFTMLTDTPQGLYPYAGVPWYNTVFGRDGIITALEMLWVDGEPARGVLRYLAETQARQLEPRHEAEPGKIVHELRRGEMAALGEIPFGRYYGTVDATPLYLLLASEYYSRTGDLATIGAIWPSLEAALGWMDEYGDVDGDGFIEYSWQEGQPGLVHQGWKDSVDSVMHADGTPPRPPVALCEVQAYAYAAYEGMARLALARGASGRSLELAERARRLRERFEQEFWCPELDCYALALDGDKRQCRVLASNAGHCLFTGIASADRALRVARQLLSQRMFTGWGIRTLARGEAAYNPMSYHNGSVWPHDNALVAAGFARSGFKKKAARVLSAMFDLGRWMELQRMPELLCGFERREGQGPVLYPVACSPQAWAAAAPLLLLQACLGLEVDGVSNEIRFVDPYLPTWLNWIEIRGLVLPGASVDLLLRRVRHDLGVEILGKTGDARLQVKKTF